MTTSRLLPLLIAVLTGCGTDDSAGPDAPLPVFDQACAERTCETGPTATDATGFDAVLAAATWPAMDDYVAGCLAASHDIPVAGTVTFSAAAYDAEFRVIGTQAGVECLGPTSYFEFTTCAELRVTDATVRLRPVDQDIHPAGGFIKLVDVLPPCAGTCAASELRCEATDTCWSDADTYCRFCLGGSPEVCACWDGETFVADGASCTFAVSGDVHVSGTCARGTCQLP